METDYEDKTKEPQWMIRKRKLRESALRKRIKDSEHPFKQHAIDRLHRLSGKLGYELIIELNDKGTLLTMYRMDLILLSSAKIEGYMLSFDDWYEAYTFVNGMDWGSLRMQEVDEQRIRKLTGKTATG